MLAGHPVPPKRKRYQDSSIRIANIVQDFENRDVLEFLRYIAHNLKFKILVFKSFSNIFATYLCTNFST